MRRRIENLVDVRSATEASDLNFRDILCYQLACYLPLSSFDVTDLHSEIRVQQHLEFETFVAFVSHIHHCLQPLPGQSDAVNQAEIVGPGLLEVLGQRRGVQSEVQLHAIVYGSGLRGQRLRLRRRLAQEFPAHRAGKPMLREGGRGVVLRRRPEYLERLLASAMA